MRNHLSNQMSYTSNSFSRPPTLQYFDRQEIEQEYPNDIEGLRIMIQNQVFNSLLAIKGQIQTKIKQIDKEIKQLKESIEVIKDTNSTKKVLQLELKQDEISQKIKQLIGSQKSLLVRNDSRRSIDKSGYLNESRQRQNSKDRKPIFLKPEVNLSTVLFPFSRNQDPPAPLQQDKQANPQVIKNVYLGVENNNIVQQYNSLIINDIQDESSAFDLRLNLSPINSSSSTVVNKVSSDVGELGIQKNSQIQSPIEGLIKNRNKFLKKKGSDEIAKSKLPWDRFGVIEQEAIEQSILHR